MGEGWLAFLEIGGVNVHIAMLEPFICKKELRGYLNLTKKRDSKKKRTVL